MAWMILHEMVSDWHRDEDADAIAKVKSREITGAQFVIDWLDCKLLDDDLSDLRNEFAASYYESGYYRDYIEAMGIEHETTDDFCRVEDTWANYAKIARILDLRFNTFKLARTTTRR
ncbi:hypothetical protein LP420_26865 [Massilia sp. B-10]|nr:hypothetical protein LP420_26865 [Massilia sp. B-10]